MHLITVNVKDQVAQDLTAKLEADLTAKGYDVLTDDRNERVGSKFSDSDLIGLPIRVTVGKKKPLKVSWKLKSRQQVPALKTQKTSSKPLKF